MIRNPLLARKYAKGLFEATRGALDLSSIERNLGGREKELSRPGMTVGELVRMCGIRPSPQLRSLFEILIRRKRQNILPEIAAMYRLISEESQGIKRAQITTAVPMSEAMSRKIEESLKRAFSATKVIVESAVEPELIGGCRIKFGDMMIDGAVSSLIEDFRQKSIA